MWFIESTSPMRMIGVEVRAVDLRGSERLSPQSPLASDAGVVSIAACVGYGRVAVGESNRWDAVKVALGRGSEGGNENSREFLKRFPVGDSFCVAIPQPRRLVPRDLRGLNMSIVHIGLDARSAPWSAATRVRVLVARPAYLFIKSWHFQSIESSMPYAN